VSSCDQFRELYEAYALGALDASERAALDAHLATGCADCAKAVAEARWLVSQLAYTAPDAGPSDMLKGRLMQTVRSEAKSASPARSVTLGIPYWVSAGIAALLLITFYSGWTAYRAKEELRAANERAATLTQQQHAAAQREVAAVEEQLAAVRRENAILTDPSAVKIMLVPQKIQAPELVAMCGKRGVVLTGQKVPMPSANHVLQLWFIPKTPGAKPMPSMSLRPDSSGRLLMVVIHPPESVGEIKALAITEEPEGGSPQPTSAIRWMGAMS
jgi:anti-sigma factor RsiW